jgi:hypothetical protein
MKIPGVEQAQEWQGGNVVPGWAGSQRFAACVWFAWAVPGKLASQLSWMARLAALHALRLQVITDG